ncbi:MAG: hypothetical protein J6S60_05305 [Oscillospiraceae bacterium]|nr:hypothetical protein [Oscillospiraceae bacterium]
MGSTLNAYLKKFEEFKALPAGQSFTIRVTEQEATEVAKEYLTENKASVSQRIQKRTGLKLSVDNPSVSFRNDEIRVSASGGMGFLKAKAALTADVKWDGKPVVVVRSVEIPFLSVTPEKLNSVVEGPLKKGTGIVEEYAEIRSFKVEDGAMVLEAVRK